MTTVDPDQMFQDHYGGRSHDDVKRQLDRELVEFRTMNTELRSQLTTHYFRCKHCGVKFLSLVNLSEPAIICVEHVTPERAEPAAIVDRLQGQVDRRNYSARRSVTPWWPYHAGPDALDPARDWRTFPVHPVCKCHRWALAWSWLVERIESGDDCTDVKPREWTRTDD